MRPALLELAVPGSGEVDIVQLCLEFVGGDALAFLAAGDVALRGGLHALLFGRDGLEFHALYAACGELGTEEVAQVGFGRVDGNVHDEHRTGSVGVWDARLMGAEVEVVCCRFRICWGCGEV